MAKFRKKPVVIEAVQWSGLNEDEVCEFMSHSGYQISTYGDAPQLHIWTLEGTHLANFGDWIIKGIKVEFYPCKPDIFYATYEPAD